MIVPSISKSKPLKLCIIGELENLSSMTPFGVEGFIVVVLPTEIAISVEQIVSKG
jgi:hypothetical protein